MTTYLKTTACLTHPFSIGGMSWHLRRVGIRVLVLHKLRGKLLNGGHHEVTWMSQTLLYMRWSGRAGIDGSLVSHINLLKDPTPLCCINQCSFKVARR